MYVPVHPKHDRQLRIGGDICRSSDIKIQTFKLVLLHRAVRDVFRRYVEQLLFEESRFILRTHGSGHDMTMEINAP